MSDKITLGSFAAALLLCVLTGQSVLYALAAGFALFLIYGMLQGLRLKDLIHASFTGIASVKTVLITLTLIGALSGLWRACGTIPFIVTCAAGLLQPGVLPLIAFLLCCLISVFTGTAFGTAATAGVICMTMAKSMDISPVIMGGAVLSGAYFGDRCSPVSTSALLISSLTQTSLYSNLRSMLKTAFVPFLASCLIYGLLGITGSGTSCKEMIPDLFAGFSLRPILLLPAAAILVCSLLRLDVRLTMLISISLSALLAAVIQGTDPRALAQIMLTGFHPKDDALAAVLTGGGVLSMAKVLCIVCLSSACSGVFRVTGLLENLRQRICRLSEAVSPYGSTLAASCCMALISCNQTLTILLTWQLCLNPEHENITLASSLEDSAVVVAPLVPWSIAAAVPLASISAPLCSIPAACFLYLIPAWRIVSQLWIRRQARRTL